MRCVFSFKLFFDLKLVYGTDVRNKLILAVFYRRNMTANLAFIECVMLITEMRFMNLIFNECHLALNTYQSLTRT